MRYELQTEKCGLYALRQCFPDLVGLTVLKTVQALSPTWSRQCPRGRANFKIGRIVHRLTHRAPHFPRLALQIRLHVDMLGCARALVRVRGSGQQLPVSQVLATNAEAW